MSVLVDKCINKNSLLYDAVKEFVHAQINEDIDEYRGLDATEIGQLVTDKIAEVTDKLDQKAFEDWYGNGEKDVFGQPKVVDSIYFINDKREKISIKDLFNDQFWEKRQKYSKDLTSLDKIKTFLDEGKVAIAKRISAFRDTKYAERLRNLLDYLKKLDESDHLKALTAHYDYMLKTTADFEMRFNKFDKLKGVKSDKSQDKEYKNFLIQAHNFLQSFSKVKNLDSPVIGSEEEREIIESLKGLEGRIVDLTNRTNSEIEGVVRDRLEEFISNPEVKQGVIDFLAAQTDESKVQSLLDALGDSHVSFIAGIDKLFKRAMFDRDEEARELSRSWDEFVKSFKGQFDGFLDRVLEKVDGSRTGRFIQKYDEAYYTTLFDYKNRLNAMKAEGKEKTQPYIQLLGEYYTWRKENTEQKYNKEYYDALNHLIPQARKLKEEIDLKKSLIISKGKDKLTLEDYEELRELDEEMRRLKSNTYVDKTEKTGEDLEIANSLFKYSRAMSKFYYTLGINEKGFNKAKKAAQEENDKNPASNHMERWLAHNTVEDFSDAFWTFFDKLRSRMPTSEKLKEVEEDIKQLTIAYKNEKGELKVDELSEEIRKKLEALQDKKGNIKAMLNESLPLLERLSISHDFKRFIVFEPTSEYAKALGEMNRKLNGGGITQQEFNRWYDKNHSTNEYTGEMEPLSVWTKMKPRDPKFIVRKPNKYWRTTDIKPEFFNPNFNPDVSGYANPTDKWMNKAYQSLNDEDRAGLEEIQKRLLYLTEHTKNDIIKRGYLPAVPTENRTAWEILTNKRQPKESEFTDIAITESDEIVKFIPLLYVKKLNQEALPVLGTGTTEKENKEIEERRKKIIEENRKAHGTSIDFNLADTMKAFIKTALNHKYKSSIEIDMKIFKEQMKRQKIKVTNAKGDKIFDKIKSQIAGNRTEHEVSAVGSNAEKHFTQWLDAVFYEDFELDEGLWSSGVNKMLDFTSLTTLGLNVFSGINNKLIGNLQERIESAGGTHFGYSHYREARKEYARSLTNYVADHNTDKASNITNGFIKYFDVLISQDEMSRKPEGKLRTIAHKLRQLKSAAYFMQHLGEHQIQNTTLLAMAKSHRIVDGKIINFNEFWEGRKHKISFDKKMTEAEMNEEFKKMEINYDIQKSLKEQFESYPKIIESFEMKDGYLTLKEGVVLEKNELFNFKQRVIGINQRLHGIYNTEDAAMFQREALGRLAMQFRKWMRPMWNRRFGRRFGKKDYNERIRDYEEGMYVSTFKFVFNPTINNWKEYKKLQEKTAAKAFKMVLDSIKDTFTHAKIRWHTLSEMEKANVKRTAWEFLFLVGVICLGFMFKNIKGEGDDDDNKGLVLALYQCDRLFGELTTFTPMGIVREGNRLFSSPAPVFSTFEDVFKLGSNLFLYPFRDEEDREFKSGIYHGEDKIEIYFNNMLPFINQIQRWDYMGEHNQRYGFFK